MPGQDWRVGQTADALTRRQAVEPVIIVGIYDTGRERVGPILRFLFPATTSSSSTAGNSSSPL